MQTRNWHEVFAVPAPGFFVLAKPLDFRAVQELGAEIELLVLRMTIAWRRFEGED